MSDYMTRLGAKLGTNDFGMVLLDRDSDTDWWNQRDDLPVGDESVLDERLHSQIDALLGEAKIQTRVQNDIMRTEACADALVGLLDGLGVIEKPNLLALLDASMPAKVTNRVTDGWVMPISRQPDFYDNGMAWWVGEYGVVGYNATCWSKAASVIEGHGIKVTQAVTPSEYGFTVEPYGLPFEACMGKGRNLAYTLWTIAEQAVQAWA